MTAFNPDTWVQGDPGERDEMVEFVDAVGSGTTRVRHEDGTTSDVASYLVFPYYLVED